MAHVDIIGPLFSCVLQNDIRRYRLKDADIRTGIQNMKEVYKPNPTSLSSQYLDVANYNDAAHRCAYLHKYAPFHTAVVADLFGKALQQTPILKREILNNISRFGKLQICSLGGGPGTDVFGLIMVLVSEFGFFQMSATIVDCMVEWNATFASLVQELREGNYGDLCDFVQPQYFSWDYIGHNLLGKMNNTVNKAIQNSYLITMVKFVSAAACKDTPEMLKKIFRSLKPGAFILYIDNAGGGFHQMIQKCANECYLSAVFGPLKHQKYINTKFNVKRFGYTPCLETTVSFQVWRKPIGPQNLLLASDYFNNRSNSQPTQIRNFNSAINQYKITNTNVFVTNINQIILPQNNTYPNQNYKVDTKEIYSENPTNFMLDQKHKSERAICASAAISNQRHQPERVIYPSAATSVQKNQPERIIYPRVASSDQKCERIIYPRVATSDQKGERIMYPSVATSDKKNQLEHKIYSKVAISDEKNQPEHAVCPRVATSYQRHQLEDQLDRFVPAQTKQPRISSSVQHEQNYNSTFNENYDDSCACCVIL